MSAHFSTARLKRPRYVKRRGQPWPSIMNEDRVCVDCGAPFEPICPTVKCPARRVVLTMFRVEAGEGSVSERHYGPSPAGAWGLIGRDLAMRIRREAVAGPRYAGRNRAGSNRRDAKRSRA